MSGSSVKNDLAFGEQSEMNNLEVLQTYLDTTLDRKGGYATFDFENPTKTIFVELKSRRINHDSYDTAIIGLNKIAFCDHIEGVQYWLAFCYLDGIWVVKYEKELFDTFEVRHDYVRGARNDSSNQPSSIVMIPIQHLTKVNLSDLMNKQVETTPTPNEIEPAVEEEKTPDEEKTPAE
jgi:hypothetical protein